MILTKKKRRLLSVLLVCLTIQLSACGYLLYPERSGQESGKLDLTVVVLDTVGLLFFVVPGVISYAVDIYTGTIYLPPGEKSVVEKHVEKLGYLENIKIKPIDPNEVPGFESISRLVSVHSGYDFTLADVRVVKANESNDLALSRLDINLKDWKVATE